LLYKTSAGKILYSKTVLEKDKDQQATRSLCKKSKQYQAPDFWTKLVKEPCCSFMLLISFRIRKNPGISRF